MRARRKYIRRRRAHKRAMRHEGGIERVLINQCALTDPEEVLELVVLEDGTVAMLAISGQLAGLDAGRVGVRLVRVEIRLVPAVREHGAAYCAAIDLAAVVHMLNPRREYVLEVKDVCCIIWEAGKAPEALGGLPVHNPDARPAHSV